ncbi:MAG: DNA translocase FtsK [Bacteroides sp.]|nr:DNA translocase FtsK [Bacteroides sp.]
MSQNRNNNHDAYDYQDTYNPVFDFPETRPTPEAHDSREDIPLPPSAAPKDTQKAPRERVVKGDRRAREKKKKEKPERKRVEKTVQDAGNLDFSQELEKIKAFFTSQTTRWLTGIFLGCFGIYLIVAFVSYFATCVADQAAIMNTPVGSVPPVENAAGEGGARISELLINESFGLGSFVIIGWIVAVALRLLSGKPRFKLLNFTIKCIVALITVSLIVGLVTISLNSSVNWGGYHGRYVNEFIIGFVGWTGAVILCLALIATFFVICLRDFVNWVLRKRAEIAERRRKAAELKAEQERLERELEEMRLREMQDAIRAGEASGGEEKFDDKDQLVQFEPQEAVIDPSISYELDDTPLEDEAEPVKIAPRAAAPSGVAPEAVAAAAPVAPAAADSSAGAENAGAAPVAPSAVAVAAPAAPPAPSVAADAGGSGNPVDAGTAHKSDAALSEEEDEEQSLEMVVNVNEIDKADRPDPSKSSIKEMYRFPSPMLLREGSHKVTIDIQDLEANKDRIRETLLYHKIPITEIEATVGPTVTLYEIRPDQGVKIARIKNLSDDLALSLSAVGVRIIAPIPGKGTVGIEVPNAQPQTVSMRTVIQSRKYVDTTYDLPVAIGSTIGNDVYIADLAKMPHLLVAGATGQGKSVGLNAIIASLLYKKRPDELKLVMVDPKEVEFSLYAKIEKHYLARLDDSDAIVTDMQKVVPTLNSLCVEMDNRYKLLRAAESRNIKEYNAKIAQHTLDPAEGHRFLPYIVLVVDEFADLIMTAGKEVETPIARLAQKARAIGIHVIIATQRPSTNVITGIIKANFPVRIAFKVSSGIDSKTILDATGAQSLIGRGDMLISNNSEMVRVQCAFIDTPEVEAICNYIQSQPFGDGPYQLPEPPMSGDGDGGIQGGGGIGERDPLFEEVAELVVTSGVGSTSGIQRRYSIGYNRAGKIMDQLEHYGVVGPSLGGKPRQVLMDMYALEELLKNLR